MKQRSAVFSQYANFHSLDGMGYSEPTLPIWEDMNIFTKDLDDGTKCTPGLCLDVTDTPEGSAAI